jgi:hypothetical protein
MRSGTGPVSERRLGHLQQGLFPPYAYRGKALEHGINVICRCHAYLRRILCEQRIPLLR